MKPLEQTPVEEANLEIIADELNKLMRHIREGNPGALFIGGVMGAGKSTLAGEIAKKIGSPVVVLDIDYLPNNNKDNPGNGAQKWEKLEHAFQQNLQAGKPSILAATFRGADTREEYGKLADQYQALWLGIWIDMPPQTAIDSVRTRAHHPDSIKPSPVQSHQNWWSKFDQEGGLAAVKSTAWQILPQNKINQLLSLLQ